MKKVRNLLVLVLAALMIFAMVGCGKSEQIKLVEKKICGSWGYVVYSIDGPCYQFYIFSSDGKYEAIWENENAPSKSSESSGKYEVEEKKITLYKSNGDVETVIEYTLDGDELKLVDKYSDGSGDNELTRVD